MVEETGGETRCYIFTCGGKGVLSGEFFANRNVVILHKRDSVKGDIRENIHHTNQNLCKYSRNGLNYKVIAV